MKDSRKEIGHKNKKPKQQDENSVQGFWEIINSKVTTHSEVETDAIIPETLWHQTSPDIHRNVGPLESES